jgi:hypothetical protein
LGDAIAGTNALPFLRMPVNVRAHVMQFFGFRWRLAAESRSKGDRAAP